MRFAYYICFLTLIGQVIIGQPPKEAASSNTNLIIGAAIIGGLYITNRVFNQPLKVDTGLENLNIITFDPQSQCAAQDFEEIHKDLVWEQGIKEILHKIVLKQPIDTLVRIPNSQLKKDRAVQVSSGVPCNKKTIFIYSSGWIVGACGQTMRSDGYAKDNSITPSGGVGAHLVNRYMRFGILNGTTVTFDYPTDTRRAFTAGQEDDLVCLKNVYDAVVCQNPDAAIVLVGDCKGGTTILNLISHPAYYDQLPQVKGILIESPPASVAHVAYNIADRWVWALPGSKYLLHGLFRLALPAYDCGEHIHTILKAKKEHIPTDLPILIGRIFNDDIANELVIEDMIHKLRENGNNKVYLYTCRENIMHARMGKIAEFQQVANAFFERHGFTHEKALSAHGKTMLDQSRTTESWS